MFILVLLMVFDLVLEDSSFYFFLFISDPVYISNAEKMWIGNILIFYNSFLQDLRYKVFLLLAKGIS